MKQTLRNHEFSVYNQNLFEIFRTKIVHLVLMNCFDILWRHFIDDKECFDICFMKNGDELMNVPLKAIKAMG